MEGMVAHRASYEVHKGPIPAGMFVCHSCDYRRCINPNHLFLGTAEDNTKDMISKGRDNLQNSLKLSDDIARLIKSKHAERYYTNKEIGDMFGVSSATVSRIGTGQSYGWI